MIQLIAIALLAPLPLLEMQASTYLVDGSGLTAGTTHQSIDSAAAAAVPGDTILVVGLNDGAGNPIAYSNSPSFWAGNGHLPEVWPIDLRVGVTLKSTGSIPVYIWSTNSTNGLPLIDVIETSGTDHSIVTRIEDLRMGAADKGIRIHHSAADYTVLIKDVVFAHLGDAVDAKASGVNTSVAIRGCQVRDDPPVWSPSELQPATVAPSRGFLLQAALNLSSAPGVLTAEVTSLTTKGEFNSMAPVPWDFSPALDLERNHGIDVATRLIEVYAHESGIEEYPGAWGATPSYTRNQVPEVILTVNGGELVGRETEEGPEGWDIGIYAHADGNNLHPNEFNYLTGFEVTAYDVPLKNFDISGIVGATFGGGRGVIELRDETFVRNSGPAGAPPGGQNFNGVHMFSMEGYLALIGDQFQADGNAGSGIWLNYGGEHLGIHPVPEGLFVDLRGCASHDNGDSGIRMWAASDVANPAGTVGGTTHEKQQGAFIAFSNMRASLCRLDTGSSRDARSVTTTILGFLPSCPGMGSMDPT